MDVVCKNGFAFTFNPGACRICPGYCCRGTSGKVWVSLPEIERICSFLQMNVVDFMDRYLWRVENRLSFQERAVADGLECIFFDETERRCSIYQVRPSGCRTYPFWDHFKADPQQVLNECPGIREIKKS
jgi:Fe-S-cluster containining protein